MNSTTSNAALRSLSKAIGKDIAPQRSAKPARPARRVSLLVTASILVVLGVVALLAPWLSPYDPLKVVGPAFIWPGQDWSFPLGTDSLGRDVLSGIFHGAGVSIFIALASTVLGLLLGVGAGAAAGYFGGLFDDLVVGIIGIFQTIPNFVLLVVVVAVAPPSTWAVVLGVALVSWDFMARLTRAEFRSLKEKEYVLAARSEGYGHLKIVFREILPNAMPSIVAGTSVMVANAILMESAMSFIGLGDPNAVSWGSMIGAGREVLRSYWYLTAIPGAFIVITVLSLNVLADRLNQMLNPQHRQHESEKSHLAQEKA